MWGARERTNLRRAAALVLGAVMVTSCLGAGSVGAVAQERPWSLRDLFFPKRDRFPAPPPPHQPKARKAQPPRKAVAPAAPAVDKAPDARVVLVVGDFMANDLADGLEEVFADNPTVRIVDRSKGSSGFVRDDVYDWPSEIKGVIEAEKPAAVLVMMGSNDRQQMKVNDQREPPRSDGWNKEYAARTEALGKAIEDEKVPYLWVGLPAFKPGTMTDDMLAFNDVYHAAAQDTGGEFVDIWEGFVDENGAFVSTGPDVNGQPVRLRTDDGINMTIGGKRKLAFYAEKPLLKILGLATPDATVAAPAATVPLLPDKPAVLEPAIIDRTPPMQLTDPALDGGTELLGADLAAPGTSVSGNGKPAVEAIASPVTPGRADDFRWPPDAAPGTPAPTTPASAQPASATSSTGAIRP